MNTPDYLSPVALFVYNRLDNTRKTVEHLQKNFLAEDTVLYVFSDGGKDTRSWKEVNAVRSYLKGISGFKEIHLVERERNYYLERNIIEGIAHVLLQWDCIIVLEDDICTSPYFLTYMNDALTAYAHTPKVMHVSAFTNLHIEGQGDTYFTPHMAGWGWGTWKDRWSSFRHYSNRTEALQGLQPEDLDKIQYGGAFPCLKSLDRQPIPWDICWELAIYKKGGLCLSPTKTLVRNIGLYAGTHFKHYRIFGSYHYDRSFYEKRIKLPDEQGATVPQANPAIEALYPQAFKDHGMRYTAIGKAVRFLYLKFIRKDR